MLLVLGVTLVVTSSLAVTAMNLMSRQRSVSLAQDERLAEDLLRASEPIVTRWLARDASRAVAPPASESPHLEVASIDIRDGSIQIDAYDLLGMMPATAPYGHPLWRALPSRPEASDLGVGSLAALSEPMSPVHPSRDASQVRLGEIVSFAHSADQRRPQHKPVVLNINTTPRPLLEAALRLAQRGDLASIMTSRAEGRAAPAPVADPGAAVGTQGLVRLVGRSTLWAVRVDVRQGSIERSWWTVYQSRGRGWQILERHAIAE
ncbi:MAG: hypothetical protein AAGF47_06965 [Planctomycetota bacterium]